MTIAPSFDDLSVGLEEIVEFVAPAIALQVDP
jgi:hypothetical protein